VYTGPLPARETLKADSKTHRSAFRVGFDVVTTNAISLVSRKNQGPWLSGRLRKGERHDTGCRAGEQEAD
jgi:hypothetical protein